MVKLFIKGFPLDITELELVKLFSNFIGVTTVKIVRDRTTGKCKGYAFIETTDQAGAEMAVNALNGKIMEEKELTVKVTEDRQPTIRTISIAQPPTVNYVKVERQAVSVKKKRPRRPL
jgi:RNA recognition motif-containing protein